MLYCLVLGALDDAPVVISPGGWINVIHSLLYSMAPPMQGSACQERPHPNATTPHYRG